MDRALRAVARQGEVAVRLTHPPRDVRRTLGLLALVCGGALAFGGCASPGMPPGGPTDKITPDSGATNLTKLREVVFRFDEVVSERPRGVPTLDQLVTISPSDGGINVDWRREAIAIRPKKGWRPNTAYTITIQPGLSDLAANATTEAIELQFSTGPVIPTRTIRGAAFDWVGQKVAVGGRIEATIGTDTTLRWVARVDSTGNFRLKSLPDGTLRLRAFMDANSNRVLDRTEKWDTATVTVSDTLPREIYLFEHDSLGPSLGEVTRGDSTALKVKFTRPILPGATLDSNSFRVMRVKDSTYIGVLRVASAGAFDTLLAARKKAAADSASRADTSTAARLARARADSVSAAQRQDSVKKAQAAEIAKARDTTRKVVTAKLTRVAPLSEVVLELLEPVLPNVPLQISVKDAVGLSGAKRSSARQFTYKPPPPPKDTTKVDAKGKAPATVKDTTAKGKVPAPTDTLLKKRP
jgi:hypothetical protein